MKELKLQPTVKLHDNISECPFGVFIDAVIDDKLESLIISGNPTNEELIAARKRLTTDFIELSGCEGMSYFSEIMRTYYSKRNIVSGYNFAIMLIRARRYDKAIEFLNANGMKCSVPEMECEHNNMIAEVERALKYELLELQELEGKYRVLVASIYKSIF